MDKHALTIIALLWLIWLAYKGQLYDFVTLAYKKKE